MERTQRASRRPVARPVGLYDRSEPHWWLRATSSGWDTPHAALEEREMTRRSRLLSWIVPGIVVCALLLAAGGLRDPATLIAAAATVAGSVVVLALNRAGFVAAAATLLVALVVGALLGAIINEPSHLLDTVYLPAYDLLAVAVIIAASVMPRGAAFVVATINVGLICGDYFLQPKGGDLLKWQATNGALWLLARPIALQIIVAAVAFLWVRGADEALHRADRAEDFAALEHAFAEQRRQLEIGARQILETHVRAANGDYSARAPLNEDNVLWQTAASLNNLLNRLQRAGGAEHQLRRTEEELRRLATAMDDASLGRRPVWPSPAGTAADLILERLPAARSAHQATGSLPAIPGAAMSRVTHTAPARAALNPPSRAALASRYGMSSPQSAARLPAIVPPAMERAHPSGQLGTLPPWLQELMTDSDPKLRRAAAPSRPLSGSPLSAAHWPLGTPPSGRGEPHSFGPLGPVFSPEVVSEDAKLPASHALAPTRPRGQDEEIGDDWPQFLRSVAAGRPTPDAGPPYGATASDQDVAAPLDSLTEE